MSIPCSNSSCKNIKRLKVLLIFTRVKKLDIYELFHNDYITLQKHTSMAPGTSTQKLFPNPMIHMKISPIPLKRQDPGFHEQGLTFSFGSRTISFSFSLDIFCLLTQFETFCTRSTYSFSTNEIKL